MQEARTRQNMTWQSDVVVVVQEVEKLFQLLNDFEFIDFQYFKNIYCTVQWRRARQLT